MEKKKYHTAGTIPKYHTAGTILKYHTAGTILKYHTAGTIPKSNRKNRNKMDTISTHFPDLIQAHQ